MWFAIYKDGDNLFPCIIPYINDFTAACRYAKRNKGNFELVGVVSREIYATLF